MDTMACSIPMGSRGLPVVEDLPCFPGSLRLVRLCIYQAY